MAGFNSMGSSSFSFNDQNQHFTRSSIDLNINNSRDGYNPNLSNVERTFSQISFSSEVPSGAATNVNSQSSEEMGQENDNSGNNGEGTTEAGPQPNPQFHPYARYLYPPDPRSIVHLPVWPEAVIPFHCGNCQVLREIIHTNGVDFRKLEIHGRVGFISHAIHNCKFSVPSPNGQTEAYSMVDFSQRSLDEIKDFLKEYCQWQNVHGYVVVADPFSSYYEALTIGLEWTEDFNDDVPEPNLTSPNAPDQNPTTAGGTPRSMELVAVAEDDVERNARTSLSEKRERTARLRLVDLADYFHLPIEEAARQLDVCITVVKKICRKDGLARWPYRKVNAIVKQVSVLRNNLETEDEAAKARAQAEIDRLTEEMLHHCGGVRPTALDFAIQLPLISNEYEC